MIFSKNRSRSAAIVILFAAVLATVVILEQLRIDRLREGAADESVRADWAAASSVYRVEGKGGEASAMQNVLKDLHCIFVLTDAKGAPLQSSTLYREIGAPFPPAHTNKPRLWEFTAAAHSPATPRSGRYVFLTDIVQDRDNKVYQLTVGKPL